MCLGVLIGYAMARGCEGEGGGEVLGRGEEVERSAVKGEGDLDFRLFGAAVDDSCAGGKGVRGHD